MKFMSKNPRLNIVLRPAIPADPISGRQGIAGLYVLFENHEANIEKQELIDLLLNHIGYERDFFKISEDNIDDLIKKQNLSRVEPAHKITDLSTGRMGESIGDNTLAKITPEMRKLITELASAAAKDMYEKRVANDAVQAPEPIEEVAQVVTTKKNKK